MKKTCLLILCLLLTAALSSCMKTYTYQVNRADQSLASGNRGYVMGKVPTDEPERKTTRTMMGVDIELPPSKDYKARKAMLDEELARERPAIREEKVAGEKPAPAAYLEKHAPIERIRENIKEKKSEDIKYTIQKGDTLQKIAKKYLGKSSRWPEIYDYNKGIVNDPGKIYPGQVIVIPGETSEPEYK